MNRVVVYALAVAAALASGAPVAVAQLPALPGDPFAVGHGLGQDVTEVPVERRAEPPLDPTPQAPCGPGSRPEPSFQGRVPAGSASDGLWCNLAEVSHQGTTGGFKTWRYMDAQGHECAYYDTEPWLGLTNGLQHPDQLGVVVLDMTDPSHPVQTARLTEIPMLSPHESLVLNQARGLLAAVAGIVAKLPGYVSIYDVSIDCRHPVLRSTAPVARFGHEAGFSEDGRTFYATDNSGTVTAVDVSDPSNPRAVWIGQTSVHGMSLNADGTRAYIADGSGSLMILDSSEIQARKPNPEVREISRLAWQAVSIPQNAYRFMRDGRPYLLEFDEFGSASGVGAARIIDISDETKPYVVANLRLEVNNPAGYTTASNDPGHDPGQDFTAHYCDLDRRVDPTVVACSFIASGLRVFDISDVLHPKEIAYFVPPTRADSDVARPSSAFSMSKPSIVDARREIWFTDGPTGFWVVRLAPEIWPAP